MRILRLHETLWELFDQSKKEVTKWGMVAKEKADRLQQTPADKAKKLRRKFVQASKRRNRGK